MAAEETPQGATVRGLMADWLGRVSIRSAQVLLTLALVYVIVNVLLSVTLVVIPFLIALILAAALGPAVNLLVRHGSPPVLATAVVLVTALLVIGGVVTLITNAVRSQWDELVASATEGVNQLRDYVSQLELPIDPQQITDVQDAVADFVTSSQFGSGALAGVSATITFFTGLLLTIFLLFFFLKDGGKIWDFLLRPFSGERLDRGHRIGLTSLGVLGGYVRGTALIALVDSVAIGIGLAILQVPLALPLAVLIFIGAFVPIVGATVTGTLAALVALFSNGPTAALIVIIIVVVVQQVEGNLLQPLVMGQTLSLHPLVIALVLTAGTVLGGIVGAILAVPITAVAWAIVKEWNGPGEQPVWAPHPPRRRKRAVAARE